MRWTGEILSPRNGFIFYAQHYHHCKLEHLEHTSHVYAVQLLIVNLEGTFRFLHGNHESITQQAFLSTFPISQSSNAAQYAIGEGKVNSDQMTSNFNSGVFWWGEQPVYKFPSTYKNCSWLCEFLIWGLIIHWVFPNYFSKVLIKVSNLQSLHVWK